MIARILLLTLLLSPFAAAGIINDPFPGLKYPTGGYDVIGERTDFDIQSLAITSDTQFAYFDIRFNFRNAALDPYQFNNVRLDAGDLLFEMNGAYLFGIPLRDHAGSPNPGGLAGGTVTAGQLYSVNDATGVMTARQALGTTSGLFYRFDEVVWLRNTGGSLTALGSPGSVSINALGDGLTNAEYSVLVTAPLDAGFVAAMQSGDLRVHFSSATCANDILEGPVPAPEPVTFALAGFALLAAGVLKRKAR